MQVVDPCRRSGDLTVDLDEDRRTIGVIAVLEENGQPLKSPRPAGKNEGVAKRVSATLVFGITVMMKYPAAEHAVQQTKVRDRTACGDEANGKT